MAVTDNIPKALNEAAAGNTVAAAELQALYGKIGENYAEAAKIKTNVGDSIDTPLTIRTRSLAELETQQRTQALATEAGFNADMAVDINAILLRDIREAALKSRSIAQKLAVDKSVSLFDDPLTAIANAFTIPWDEQALQGLQQQKDVAAKALSDVTAGVTNAAATSKLIATKVTDASIQDQTLAIENMMKSDRLRGQAKALEQNVYGVKAAMESNDRQLYYALELDKWKDREENQAWMREQRTALREERKYKLGLIEDQNVADKERMRFANAALAELGMQQFTDVGQMKARMLTASEKARMDDLVNKGMLLTEPKTLPFFRHGDTVYETLDYWTKNGKAPQTPDERTIMQIVRDAGAEGEKAGKPGQPQTKAKAADDFLKQSLQALEKVKKDDDSNPLRPASLGTLASRPAVANNPVFQKVIAPQITDGNRNLTAHPTIVFPMVADAVSAGTIKPAEAANFIANFYKGAAKLNTENLKLGTMTGYSQTKIISDIEIGMNPSTKLVSDAVMATGAAMAASGVGFMPGAAVAGVGAAGNMYARSKATIRNVDWTDPVQVQSVLVRKAMVDRGIFPAETGGFPTMENK